MRECYLLSCSLGILGIMFMSLAWYIMWFGCNFFLKTLSHWTCCWTGWCGLQGGLLLPHWLMATPTYLYQRILQTDTLWFNCHTFLCKFLATEADQQYTWLLYNYNTIYCIYSCTIRLHYIQYVQLWWAAHTDDTVYIKNTDCGPV